jgi:hypothetical protein
VGHFDRCQDRDYTSVVLDNVLVLDVIRVFAGVVRYPETMAIDIKVNTFAALGAPNLNALTSQVIGYETQLFGCGFHIGPFDIYVLVAYTYGRQNLFVRENALQLINQGFHFFILASHILGQFAPTR